MLINFDKTEDENKSIKEKSQVKYIATLQSDNIESLCLDEPNTFIDENFIDFNSLGNYAIGKMIMHLFFLLVELQVNLSL